jgi:hypothetical protein
MDVNRQEQMRELMQEIYLTHRECAKVWQETKDANYKPRELVPKWSDEDSHELFRANGIAYKSAEPLSNKLLELLRKFFQKFVDPVYAPFLNGDRDAIDQVIDFLEIDIPAFRLGYQKEQIYRELKKIDLSAGQIARLKQIALALCTNDGYRRELSYTARLMSKLADREFIEELEALERSDDPFAQRKAH